MRLSIRRAGGIAAPRLAFDLQEWSGAIGPLSRLFTRPVVRGIQVAVGLLLIKTAVDMATSGQVLRGHDDVYLSFGADVPVSLLLALGTAAVVALAMWRRGLPAGLIVLALGVVAGLAFGSAGMLSGLSV